MALWLSRIASLLALLALLAWILVAGDVIWAVRTFVFSVIPMAFIWFPEQVYRPGSRRTDDRQSKRATLGVAVMGWILLAIIAVVRIRMTSGS